ncbi:MAG TPA: hypothetical protein VFV71_13335 [Burkholderiales bacterium]|nr:hypothetical protein [Burkholderiales bacterium]
MNDRGLTIHFMDGTKMSLNFPKQAENEAAVNLKLNEVLNARHMLVEVDGGVLLIPFENVKYIQASPGPVSLPKYAIRAASISS